MKRNMVKVKVVKIVLLILMTELILKNKLILMN